MSSPYPLLFSPSKLGTVTLKNRLIRSATFENLADADGNVTDEYVEFHRRLAKGGVGLIITGLLYVQKEGKFLNMVGIDNDNCIPGLKKVAEVVHREGNGCRIALQIGHCGRQLHPQIERETVAPSAITEPFTGRTPRAMSTEEVEEFIDACAAAIRRAREADFDAVQLHAAHGWLLSSFLSPHTNRRQDIYGGSTENRARIMVEIYRRAVKQVGNDFPIFAKINAHDFVEGGIDLAESLRIAKLLSDAGFIAFEVSSCMWETLTRKPEEIGWRPARIPEARIDITSREKEAYHRSFARAFKKNIKDAAIILVGGLRSPDLMEEILTCREADFVSLSRPLIREPELPNLWQSGKKTTADCISCNTCVTGRKKTGLYCFKVKEF